MKIFYKIIGYVILSSAVYITNGYSEVTGPNTTLASRTIAPDVLKKSHEALCEQMGMKLVDPSQGKMTLSSGTQDAVLCAGSGSNDSMRKTLQRGVPLMKPGQIMLGPIPQEEIDRLNNLPIAEEKKTASNVDSDGVSLTSYVSAGSIQVGTMFNFFGWADYSDMPMPSTFDLYAQAPANGCSFAYENYALGQATGQISAYVICTASVVGSVLTYSNVRITQYHANTQRVIVQYRP